MNPKFLKSMRAKKKRVMDPNIVRPNLLSHDKEIRGIKSTHEVAMATIMDMQDQIRRLERKLRAQSDYLNVLHSRALLKK